MLRLHDAMSSGNGYKVRLALARTGRPFVYVPVDLYGGETRTAAFRALNPAGQVPVLELGDGRVLTESNAILVWLADGTALWPEDRWDQAQALRWLFWEQYSHEPHVAVARSWVRRGTAPSAQALAERQARGRAALQVMDDHLARHDWFAGGAYSVADIALYAYTHVAPDGGIDLDPFPHVRAWIDRVAAQAAHVTIDTLPPEAVRAEAVQ